MGISLPATRIDMDAKLESQESLTCDGFVDEELVCIVDINWLILSVQKLLERDFFGVIASEDDSGFDRFQFGRHTFVGHLTGPHAFQR